MELFCYQGVKDGPVLLVHPHHIVDVLRDLVHALESLREMVVLVAIPIQVGAHLGQEEGVF